MNTTTLAVAITAFTSWGVGSLLAKMAADKIGTKSVFLDLFGYVPAILIFSLIFFKNKNLFLTDKNGVILAILAGTLGSLGSVAFYYLLSRSEASSAVPLTALYPALTAVLAFIFLNETLGTTKIIGILFSILAIYLLSK